MQDIINGILGGLLVLTLATGMAVLYIGVTVGDWLLILCGVVDVAIVIGGYSILKK